MNLVSQWLWLGLLTLPTILILHLLRERSKRQPISSLEMWRWLEKELRGPRLRRLPVTWVLLLQLLAALGLNLALARPQFTWAQVRPPRQHLILVIDTSSSMGARDVPPTRLAQAQAGAAVRLAALGETDKVTLITAGPAARQLGSTGAGEATDLAGRLAGLRPAGDGSDWSGALALATAAVDNEFNNAIVIYTDGAAELPEGAAHMALPAQVEVNLVGQPQGNQAVVGLAVRPSPSGAVQVYARVANFADAAASRTLTLTADGSVRDEAAVALDGSGVAEHAWTLPPGVKTVSVGLGGARDVLPDDDTAAVGVPSGRVVSALLVAADTGADTTLALQRALQSLPNLQLTTIDPGRYAPYEPYDLTVFHGWLPEAWPRGGVLVVAPPQGAPLLNAQVPTTVNALPAFPAGGLLADVDLSHVDFGRAAALAAPDWLTPVLTDELGLTLVWHGATNGTRVVVFAFGLDRGNLARRTAFPVLTANAVAEVVPPPLPEAVRVGQAVELPPPYLLPFLTVVDPAGNAHNFTGDRSPLYTDTFLPGLYQLRGQTAAGQVWEGGFGVNAGSVRESDLRVSAQPALNSLAETGAAPPLPGNPPWQLWPWVVLAVLGVMVLEAWLAWR